MNYCGGWLIGRLVGWLVGVLVGWLVAWFVGWRFGCLVGWLVGWSVELIKQRINTISRLAGAGVAGAGVAAAFARGRHPGSTYQSLCFTYTLCICLIRACKRKPDCAVCAWH